MTRESVRLVREPLDSWPVLHGTKLSGAFEVLSLVVDDHAHADSVDQAGRTFRAMVESLAAEAWTLAVLGRLGTVDMSSRLSRHRIQHEGPWWLPDAELLGTLDGGRESWIEERENTSVVVAYGAIGVAVADLPRALIATRGMDSAVVAWRGPCDVRTLLQRVAGRDGTIFESASALVGAELVLVARGFGAFDDRESGVDVVSASETVDRLTAGTP